eukprot:932168-Prymnesium_polylepis.1
MASRRVAVAFGNHIFKAKSNDFEGILDKIALTRAKSLRGRLGGGARTAIWRVLAPRPTYYFGKFCRDRRASVVRVTSAL